MKELVVISGKGGTGKTSLTAAFATFASPAVVADCDVDAANLHLILDPQVEKKYDFYAGREALIRQADCNGCGKCLELCRFHAITELRDTKKKQIMSTRCEGCGVCVRFCPAKAIDFKEKLGGEWYQSTTRLGSMVHAKLGVVGENSGRLVSLVRDAARKIATDSGAEWVLIDGPPGIGCPVVASLSAADIAVIITEASVCGRHDLLRILELTRHFNIPAYTVINRWDINTEIADQIEIDARKEGALPAGRIAYDPLVTQAQIAGKTVPEHGPRSKTAIAMKNIWNFVSKKEK